MSHARPALSTVRLAVAIAFAAVVIGGRAPSSSAATGGPDTFGYTWRDSAEPGVTYAWEDISTLGRDIAVTGDDTNSGLQALGISFPYYSGVNSQVAACSNGWISLVDGTSTSFSNGPLPSGPFTPMGTIAAFWDDLIVDATTARSRILLYSTADHATVTWENVPDLGNTAAPNNFQVQLWTDGRIVVQYQQLLGDRTSCTVGIESPDETDGLTAWQDVPGGVPASSYRIEFVPPTPAPNNLDCTRARPLACGAAVSGDTRLGVANQNAYRCSRADWSGKEQIWQVTFATPTSGRLVLEPRSGAPSMIVVAACDPNACIGAPSNLVNLNNAVGTVDVVVDSAPGQEGAYDLRLDCYPIPSRLACTPPVVLGCGERISGDTRLGAANQDRYLCSTAAWGGREQIYHMDFPTPASGRLLLTATSGSPTMIVLRACDPNVCVGAPGNVVDLAGLTGAFDVVIDSAAGQEGSYDLRADCFPVPNRLDCANAGYVDCGTVVSGDLALGAANQDSYQCAPVDLSGREQVWLVDLAGPANLSINLLEITGNPDMVLVNACDPNNCVYADNGLLQANGVSGSFYIVVDCRPGQEGAYELAVDCLTDDMPFCGDALLETNPWNNANGVWLVNGWLYHPGDTHNLALRVDGAGGPTYDTAYSCTDFTSTSFGVRGLTGPAFAQWEAPEGTVREDLSQTSAGGCCGLLVNITVTNTDTVPHSYEWRVYHDTAFGTADGTGLCPGTVDGGPIEVNGTRYVSEVDLLAIGADTCEGQVQMFSGDHPDQLHSSFQMLPPNTPGIMEWDAWNQGGTPCTAWSGFVNGQRQDGCNGGGTGDSSLLFVWRFPQFGGTLAPGESGVARYRIGQRCAFPCNVTCESPTLRAAASADVGPCNDGIRVTWDAALFPGTGNGVYHLYRSTVSAADALTRPPITGPAGVTATRFIDDTTVPGLTYWYVVQAESLDYPGCGNGPVVSGSTATVEPAPNPVTDFGDLMPPSTDVGGALRANAHTTDTVSFLWPTAPLPAADEHYLVLRSDDDPEGPFIPRGSVVIQSWTDPSAPPRYTPVHVWFYKVFLADDCGNISRD